MVLASASLTTPMSGLWSSRSMAPTPNESGSCSSSRAASARADVRVFHHRVEDHARCFDILGRARLRQERYHRRSDREVLEVSELLDSLQRIDVRMVSDEQQRARANRELGVVEQPLHRGRHGDVASSIEEDDSPAADVRVGVRQQFPDGRV